MPASFTAGPWTQCDRVVVVVPETHHYGTWIANCAVGGSGGQEQLANACLIAAAPAMYEELREVLAWATTERAPLRDQEIASIRAVLRKATGSAS